MIFSLTPPIGRTFPVKDISPVIAIFLQTLKVYADTKAVQIAIPADGPSFGVAAAGK